MTTDQASTPEGQAPEGTETSADISPVVEGQEPKTYPEEVVKGLRQEAASYRQKAKRVDELEAKLAEYEQAKLTDLEKAQKAAADAEKRLEDLSAANRRVAMEYEVKLTAKELNVVDPDAALKLLDLGEIDFDEDGRPTGIKDALKTLIKAKPWLTANVDGGPAGNPSTDRRKGALTAEDVKKMSKDELAKLDDAAWEDAMRALETN